MYLRYAVLAAALALAPLAAEAQSYRCVGKDGKKYYGSAVPPQCVGVAVEQVSASGTVLKRIDPQASADERAKKEAEEASQKMQAALSKEQGRRNQALLATYASEKDVEDMRRRALEDNQRVVKDLEARIATLEQRRAAPKEDAKGIDVELQVQEGALAAKKKEVDAINARYDEEKRRYVELTRRK
jgi:chromosome segregation ATPase